MPATSDLLYFACDYQEGAHPDVLARLVETNLVHTAGYGRDAFCESAREKIRAACGAPKAAVHFLVGGTQANATVIDALVPPYAGIVSAESGHINVHEAGAVERAGHKVLAVPQTDGKLRASDVESLALAWERDENRDHMVMPGMVYVSQPTEYGTLYSLAELEVVSRVCRDHGMLLYLDGARLAYALACPGNDVALPDVARLCDAFYIGGTKCGALMGEAVVLPDPDLCPRFFTITKQHGALLAKGRILGVMFDALFTDGLYGRLGASAVAHAERIRRALRANGFEPLFEAPANQVFFYASEAQREAFARQVACEALERTVDGHLMMRLVTSWATTDEDVDALVAVIERVGRV